MECEVREEKVSLPDGRVVKAIVIYVELGKTLTSECREKLGRIEGRGG